PQCALNDSRGFLLGYRPLMKGRFDLLDCALVKILVKVERELKPLLSMFWIDVDPDWSHVELHPHSREVATHISAEMRIGRIEGGIRLGAGAGKEPSGQLRDCFTLGRHRMP